MRTRRVVLFGLGTMGAGVAAGLYRASPAFWRNLPAEMRRPILTPLHFPSPKRWPDTGLHAAWLGHATVLLKIDGYHILTDPVFSNHAGFHLGPISVGIKRLMAPALTLDDLPEIDLVVLSHAHMDHFDLPSLKSLESTSVDIVTAPSTSDLLRAQRYRQVRELRWGEAAQSGPVRVKAFEVNHWGARYRSDTYRGYNGYILEAGRYRVLFGGDTADTHTFQPLRSRKAYDLGIMPIGAYNPWIRYHCNPEQSWRMANDAGAEHLMPIHHQTFALGREPRTEPIERFLHAAGSGRERVVTQHIGQEFHIS